MFSCVAKCPELDVDGVTHCTCHDPEEMYERWVDGCPVGNTPKFVEEDAAKLTGVYAHIYMKG